MLRALQMSTQSMSTGGRPAQLSGQDAISSAAGRIGQATVGLSEDQRQRYIEYIDEMFNAERLTQILSEVAHIIGANILNVARQDYDPQGASGRS
jgi:S-adenosylmethionine/arginine decarboxylase-like enzyme